MSILFRADYVHILDLVVTVCNLKLCKPMQYFLLIGKCLPYCDLY